MEGVHLPARNYESWEQGYAKEAKTRVSLRSVRPQISSQPKQAGGHPSHCQELSPQVSTAGAAALGLPWPSF